MKNKIILLFPILIFLLLIGCSGGDDASVKPEKADSPKTTADKKDESKSKKNTGSFKGELTGFMSEPISGTNVKDMTTPGIVKAKKLYLCGDPGSCIILVIPTKDGSIEPGEYKFSDLVSSNEALLKGEAGADVDWDKRKNPYVRWDTKSGAITVKSFDGDQVSGTFVVEGTADDIGVEDKEPRNAPFKFEGEFTAPINKFD